VSAVTSDAHSHAGVYGRFIDKLAELRVGLVRLVPVLMLLQVEDKNSLLLVAVPFSRRICLRLLGAVGTLLFAQNAPRAYLYLAAVERVIKIKRIVALVSGAVCLQLFAFPRRRFGERVLPSGSSESSAPVEGIIHSTGAND